MSLFEEEKLEPKVGLDTGDGLTTADYSAWVKGVSKEVIDAGREKARSAAFNWLMINGIPKQPWDIWHLIDSVWFSSITWAGVNGYVELTEKGKRSEGEAPVITDADDIFAVDEVELAGAASSGGGYL